MAKEVVIAIATFKRPDSLTRTLMSIEDQAEVPNNFRLRRVIVVDNDPLGSAVEAVELIAPDLTFEVVYVQEEEPGVSAVRNRALSEAVGADVLVFIDDDEVVSEDWPSGLLRVMEDTDAVMVGGPVRTAFEVNPAGWIEEGGFFDRPEPADRSEQTWLRSGNLAIDMLLIGEQQFDPVFGSSGGEDVEFSSRLRASGLLLCWSSSAIVTEYVGEERTSLDWIVGRQRVSQGNYIQAMRKSVSAIALATQVLRTLVDSIWRLLVVGLWPARDRLAKEATAKLQIARIQGTFDGLRR